MDQWLHPPELLLGAGETCFRRVQEGDGGAPVLLHVWPLFLVEDGRIEDQACSGVDLETELLVCPCLEEPEEEEEEEADALDHPAAVHPAQKSRPFPELLLVSHHRWGQGCHYLTPTLHPPHHPEHRGEDVSRYSSPASVPGKGQQPESGLSWGEKPRAGRNHEYEANDFSIRLTSNYSYVL